MRKYVVILLVTLGVCGCSAKSSIQSVVSESDFDTQIVEALSNSEQLLNDVGVALEKENVPKPYTAHNNSYEGVNEEMSMDFLDENNQMVHLRISEGEVTTSRDTSEETKELIKRAIQAMLGPDVVFEIEDTYEEQVIVRAQGKVYGWKDGVLERIQ